MTEIERTELEDLIARMGLVSGLFYSMATTLRNPQFVQFNGLLNEYIDCCRRALEQGIDFRLCSAPVEAFQVNYINEKIGRIFPGLSVVLHRD